MISIFRWYGDIDFICHQEHVCLEVKTFFVADSKAGSLCCSHKTVGRQHNANILYFTANCGGGVETIGIWNGRTQEGSKINWSRFLSLWPSKDQLILALPTPSSLFWYLGKIGGGYCQWCCTSLTQVHKFCSDQFVTHCWKAVLTPFCSALVLAWIWF